MKNTFWAGYGIEGPVGIAHLVVTVSTSFILPKITCNTALDEDQEVLFIAAIDGSPAGVSDYAFSGVEAFCAAGSSTPTYTSIGSGGLIGVPVKPQNKIFAWVNVSGSLFLEGLYDVTTKMTGGVSSSDVGAALIAMECVVSSGTSPLNAAPLPLANFSKVKIGQDYVGSTVGPACYAAVQSGEGWGNPIGSYGAPTATLDKYVMYNTATTVVRAAPGALSSDLTSFKVTWKSYGPA